MNENNLVSTLTETFADTYSILASEQSPNSQPFCNDSWAENISETFPNKSTNIVNIKYMPI